MSEEKVEGQEPETPGQDPIEQVDPPKVEKPEEKLSDEDLRAIVSELRKENATRRQNEKALAAKVKAHEDAQKSEVDLAKETAETLANEAGALRAQIARYEIEKVALKLDFIDPDVAVALIPVSSLELDENGKPTNSEALLKALLRDKPHLKKGTAPAVGAINPAAGEQAANSKFEEEFKKQNYSLFARRKQVVG